VRGVGQVEPSAELGDELGESGEGAAGEWPGVVAFGDAADFVEVGGVGLADGPRDDPVVLVGAGLRAAVVLRVNVAVNAARRAVSAGRAG
jgi:hypothetical protein